jgi:hypothetical protein
MNFPLFKTNINPFKTQGNTINFGGCSVDFCLTRGEEFNKISTVRAAVPVAVDRITLKQELINKGREKGDGYEVTISSCCALRSVYGKSGKCRG